MIAAYRDSEFSNGLKQAITLILKLISSKIQVAKVKGDVVALKLWAHLKELGIKAINGGTHLIVKWLMLLKAAIRQKVIDSYEIETAIRKAEAAVRDSRKKSQVTADSIYRDCKMIFRNVSRVSKAIKKIRDSRGRISTTTTPTVWEIRQVLGVKPGMSFNERDWKAFKENGMVIVQNRQKPELRYQRSVNELISIANQERMAIENKRDPYVMNAQEQYGADYISKSEKSKIEKALRWVKTILAAVSGAVITINAISSGTKGWGAKIRRMLARLTLTKREIIDLETELINARAAAA